MSKTTREKLAGLISVFLLLSSLGCSTTVGKRVCYHFDPDNYGSYGEAISQNTIKDPVFLGLVFAAGLSWIEDDKIQDWFSDNEYFTGSNGETRGDDLLVVLSVAGPASMVIPQMCAPVKRNGNDMPLPNWPLVGEGLEVGLEAAGLTYGATKLLKEIVDEERPNKENDRSFPSGHSSMSFMGAALMDRALRSEIEIRSLDPSWRYLSIVPYTAATYVAISRVEHNKHYLHDVLAGAAIGRATSNIIYDLHYKVPESSSQAQKRGGMFKFPLQVSPCISKNLVGIQVSSEF